MFAHSWRCFSCERRGQVEIVAERGRGFGLSFSVRSLLTRGKTSPFAHFQQSYIFLYIYQWGVCVPFSLLSGHDKGYGHHFGLERPRLVSISKPYAYGPLKRAGEEEWKYCMSVSVLLPDRKPPVTNCQKYMELAPLKQYVLELNTQMWIRCLNTLFPSI